MSNIYDYDVVENDKGKNDAKKITSKILYSLTFASITALIITKLILVFKEKYFPEILTKSFTIYLSDVNTLMVFGLLYFALKKEKSSKMYPTDTMNCKKFLTLICVSLSIMFVGSLVSNVIASFIGGVSGSEIENPVNTIIEEYDILQIMISVVIIAPIFEELLFRKLLIDKLSGYGSAFCMVFSGLSFGLFHANLYQMLYATLLGMLLAYIYMVYSKVSYVIILHSVINFIGSIVPMLIFSIDEKNEKLFINLTAIYGYIYFILMIIGIVYLIRLFKTYPYFSTSSSIKKPFNVLYKNTGVIVFLIYVISLTIYNSI